VSRRKLFRQKRLQCRRGFPNVDVDDDGDARPETGERSASGEGKVTVRASKGGDGERGEERTARVSEEERRGGGRRPPPRRRRRARARRRRRAGSRRTRTPQKPTGGRSKRRRPKRERILRLTVDRFFPFRCRGEREAKVGRDHRARGQRLERKEGANGKGVASPSAEGGGKKVSERTSLIRGRSRRR